MYTRKGIAGSNPALSAKNNPTLKNKLSLDNSLLLLIIVVAAILRFWNYPNIPFMHDELSALARTHFYSLSDLIEKGAATDGHPIGVQVFLYYFIKLFGDNEMVVKFPFIICGLISIIVAYRISKFWFNSSVGLIVAAFMAVLQYFVMYSQLARPYSIGVLFSLLMVWYWSNFLFKIESVKIKYLIGYILASAICAYVHHFAFLFAIIVSITGFFFINKQNWKGYLLAAFSIFALYVPHINITLYQLGKGGVGVLPVADEHAHRPAVAGDVVHVQQQHGLIVVQQQQIGLEQRATGQVERGDGVGCGEGLDEFPPL